MKDRIDAPAPERTEVHASFVIERALTASIAAVWHALSDTAAPATSGSAARRSSRSPTGCTTSG